VKGKDISAFADVGAPARRPEVGGHGAGLYFDWNPVAPHLIHPIKVAIIEVLTYMGEPLSADELKHLLADRQHVSTISHHIKGLLAAQALVMVGASRVRGATKKCYFLRIPD